MNSHAVVSLVPVDTWDATWGDLAGPEDFFLSGRWLAVVEATSGAEIHYLIERIDGVVNGVLATAVATRRSPWLSGRPDTLLERGVRDGWPRSVDLRATLPADLAAALLPATVCGGRHLGRTRPLLRPGSGDEHDRIDRLVGAAEHLARESGTRSVSFLYVDEGDWALREVLAARGYSCHESGRYSWLDVPVGGLTEYLGTLSGHRANRIRTERRQLAAAGVHSAVEPLTARVIPRLADLETQLLRKYDLDWSSGQSAEIFARVLDTMGSDALLSTASIDGELIGFGLVLCHQGHWYAHRAGFDYAARGGLPVYFEVIYYRLIETAAAAGIRTIHYGTGSAETKRARGCHSTRQFSYLRRAERQP